MQYIILGTGPVGVIVAEYLLKQNRKVVILDNSKTPNNNSKDYTLKKSNRNIFSENIYCKNKDSKYLPVASATKGGFSEIWGGTFSELRDQDFEMWDIQRKDLFKHFEYLIELLNLRVEVKNDFKLKSTLDDYDEVFKELFKRGNTKNIEIEKSKIMQDENGIWSAKFILDNLISTYSNLKYIDDFEVTNITENNGEIILVSETQNLHFTNSKVLVCTGVLSSALIASNILKNYNFSIQNSDLKILPFIYFGKSVTNSKKIVPQAFIEFLDKNIKTQLYSVNENLLETVNNSQSKLTKFFLKIVNKFFDSRLLLLFIYSNSKQSNYFNFLNNSNKIFIKNKVKKTNLSVFHVFLRSFKQSLRLKLLPIPFYKSFPTYGSFHSGCVKFMEENKYVYKFDELGKIQNDSNIYFLDSSIFHSVPSGPTTFLSMSYALYRINKILDEE